MIDKIRIRNFKSIKEQEINLKNINIIIGANNSGKSNLIDAFYLYQRLIISDLHEVFGPGPYSYRSVFHRGSDIKSDRIEIEVQSNRVENISHFIAIENYPKILPSGRAFPIRIAKEKIKFDNIEKTEQRHEKLLVRRMWENREFTGEKKDFFSSCRSIRGFQFVPKIIKKEQEIDLMDENIPFLKFTGENLIPTLFKIRDKDPASFTQIIEEFREIYPDVKSISFKHLGENRYALRFNRKISGSTWQFLSPEVSDGFVITLAILTLIHMPNAPKIILIEELENGLNPHTLRIILEKIVKTSVKQNIQFIITTHSPVILELMSKTPEYIIVCEQIDGQSRYVSLGKKLKEFGKDYVPGESLFELWFEGLIGGL